MSNRILGHASNWKKIGKNDVLTEGMVIKGYTYFPGDFRRENSSDKPYAQKRYYGMPKLRVGIIVEKYSNNYFKVQFRNSKAKTNVKNHLGLSLVNKFEIFNSKTKSKICDLVGTDSFCMIVRRDTLSSYFKKGIVLNIDKDSIRKKHSPNKKRTEKRYFLNGSVDSLSNEKINLILKKYQFMNQEIEMPMELALEKFNCILKRHNAKGIFCVPKELKKTNKIWEDYKDTNLFIEKHYDIKQIEIEMIKDWITKHAKENLSEQYEIDYLVESSLINRDEISELVKTFKIWKNSQKLLNSKKGKKIIDQVEKLEDDGNN